MNKIGFLGGIGGKEGVISDLFLGGHDVGVLGCQGCALAAAAAGIIIITGRHGSSNGGGSAHPAHSPVHGN